MDRIFGYIFGSLKESEIAVKRVNKTLASHHSILRRTVIFSWMTVISMAMMAKHICDQDETINKLNKDIEELKKEKGE